MLTILDGTTFCIAAADTGDITGGHMGFFSSDTRHLSELRLLIEGEVPLILTSDRVEYFSAAFYLRNPVCERLPADTLTIARERVIDDGLSERLLVRNERMRTVTFTLELWFGSDFADILAVKEQSIAVGHRQGAPPLGPVARPSEPSPGLLVLDAADGSARTEIRLSQPPVFADGVARYEIVLASKEEWELVVDVRATPAGPVRPTEERTSTILGRDALHRHDSLATWRLRVPRLDTPWSGLARAYDQSIQDLAALRIHGVGAGGELPAAGMPWFMTVFGRDTVITCMQTFLLGPELARGALQALAALQADRDIPEIDAEPGKILHELRRGQAARHWFPAYYGSVDSTPLFLILLSEVWRWTSDALFVSQMREPALRALAWIDESGDRDGDGFVEYRRRTERGLQNQSWKDSGDSQRFADGSLAEPPIAPAEVQGYVYDAKLRCAELAREVWRDGPLAARLEGEAAELRSRFNDAFWIGTESQGFYALALDGDKRQVDAVASNMGHLLWSGIVPDDRVQRVADTLLGPQLWSGWGIRTMGTGCRGYNPLSYHNGTVWPHDTMLACWGLARNGRWEEAHLLIRSLLQAAGRFGWSLPEVFAGYPRAETPFPIAYPGSSRPQAWAAGASVLALQILLGLSPDRRMHRLVSGAPPLPDWVRPLRLHGVRAFETSWDVTVADGVVAVERR